VEAENKEERPLIKGRGLKIRGENRGRRRKKKEQGNWPKDPSTGREKTRHQKSRGKVGKRGEGKLLQGSRMRGNAAHTWGGLKYQQGELLRYKRGDQRAKVKARDHNGVLEGGEER